MRRMARVTMSMRELDRLKCIQAVIDGELYPHKAAERRGGDLRRACTDSCAGLGNVKSAGANGSPAFEEE
jgi:hypothetical protein